MSEQFAWLIELGSMPPQWFTGRFSQDFTTDANDAIRFAREEDARRAIFYMVDPNVARGCKAVEHGWSDRVTADLWFCARCPYQNTGPVCTKCGAMKPLEIAKEKANG